jgi:cytidine deaminase
MRQAYAPYSRFKVGAALLDTQGNIHAGCNVENASYGLTLCAERVALASAVARGTRRFQALAIVASGASAPYPCGACRQVLAEFAKPGMPVYVASASSLRSAEVLRFGDLLPHSFRFRKRQGGPRHD